jgi:poly(3-hydroxybutyrate) depolymerase
MHGDSGRMPSLRDGGPLPRPLFCSFLATAVDPSPNFGGGVVRAESLGRLDGPAIRLRPAEAGSNSPFPHAVYGGRAGNGGRLRYAKWPAQAPRTAVLPLSTRNEGGGGRGVGARLLGAALTLLALLSACTQPHSSASREQDAEPNPPPGFRLVPAPSAEAQARTDSILADIQRLPAGGWQAGSFTGSVGGEIRYRLLPPENPRPGRRYPLVVVFHGSGEIGADNEAQLTRFAKAWARPSVRRAYPAYVLAPQMPERSANYTAGPESATRASVPGRPLFAALELIDRLRAELPVDSSRVYAMGFSMGASTTFAALALRPELFAAAIPVAGVPDAAQAAAVARTPVWIIHGNSDEENPIGPDRAFVPVLTAMPGARVTFWEYDAGEHRVPADLLTSDAFPLWLWAHRKP